MQKRTRSNRHAAFAAGSSSPCHSAWRCAGALLCSSLSACATTPAGRGHEGGSPTTTQCSEPPAIRAPETLEDWRRRFGRGTFGLPESQIAMRAFLLAHGSSPGFLLNHALRSYGFALALAKQGDVQVDEELLFLGTILHDVGLTTAAPGDAPFEVRGGETARRFLTEHGYDAGRAGVVYEAITSHLDPEVEKRPPEISLIRLGSGVDVVGVAVDELSYRAVQRVVSDWPRLDFKRCFSAALQREAHQRSESTLAVLISSGLLAAIAATPFDE